MHRMINTSRGIRKISGVFYAEAFSLSASRLSLLWDRRWVLKAWVVWYHISTYYMHTAREKKVRLSEKVALINNWLSMKILFINLHNFTKPFPRIRKLSRQEYQQIKTPFHVEESRQMHTYHRECLHFSSPAWRFQSYCARSYWACWSIPPSPPRCLQLAGRCSYPAS